ncbi:PRC-barrel domain-containing protein [Aurantimonas sp. Leaf443]|uniref:PRC-barrel domain-containing protein n=1 Tax=Aurantimonas sp. Leaf443 TaxID=1736378 RepID=UPI0006F8C678|nr:PRC-barrel domain-containing protein [Aurantimonas sp. Leaf443]KQT82468.1 hypothetical protein ASG48_15450 [Aurantimonas sp. Leaf443]
MIRKLMATTALAGLLATSAFAQDAATPATSAPAAATAGATSGAAGMAGTMQSLSADQYLASRLTGQTVYASDAQDAQSIGEIRNLLIGSDGRIVSAIVDATAGDQSKTVAVPFDQVKWTMNDGDDMRATLALDAAKLASMPAFTMPEEQAAAVGGTAGTGTATPGAVPSASGGMAAGTGTAAPATGDMAAATPTTGTASDGAATSVGSDQMLSQSVIGSEVYSGPGNDANDLGKITDLVVASSGEVQAAVIGVGGFLGIGAKDVAVPFKEITMTRAGDATEPRLVLAATKEQLEQAPTFDADGDDAGRMAATGAATGAAVGAAAGNAAESARTAANNAGTAVGNAAETAGQEIAAATESAKSALGNAGERIEQAASNAGQSIENAADRAQQGAENAANDTANTVNSAATGMAAGTAAGVAAGADATTTASTGGADARAGMTPVSDAAELTADNLLGTTVYGPNNENVGDIGDIALSPQGQVDAVIVDVGGFLGIGEKPVAVSMDNLQFMRDSGGKLFLYTQFTQDQLNSAPEYDKDTYAQNRNTMRLETAPAAGGAAATTN